MSNADLEAMTQFLGNHTSCNSPTVAEEEWAACFCTVERRVDASSNVISFEGSDLVQNLHLQLTWTVTLSHGSQTSCIRNHNNHHPFRRIIKAHVSLCVVLSLMRSDPP